MDNITALICGLRAAYRTFPEPAVTQVAHEGDPFKVLVSCVLSLRTKDDVTAQASKRLFALADTPAALLSLGEQEIADAIYPAGFYRTKAGRLRQLSAQLLQEHGGEVPREIDELLKLPGVGRKTANLVVTLGYGLLGICVETDVRYPQHLGTARSGTPRGRRRAPLVVEEPELCSAAEAEPGTPAPLHVQHQQPGVRLVERREAYARPPLRVHDAELARSHDARRVLRLRAPARHQQA